MTRHETRILKGVAILLMLYLHLFNRIENVELCANYLWIGNEPLVYWLHFATNPVPIFLVLSGYGLHYSCSHHKGCLIPRKQFVRVGTLFLHWWVIIAIFTIPVFLYRGGYYSDIRQVLLNYTAFHTTWYSEGWFLFPYIIVSSLSVVIFRIIEKIKPLIVLVIAICMGFLGCGLSVSASQSVWHEFRFLGMFIYVLIFLSPFLLGGLLHRTNAVERIKSKIGGSRWVWILFFGLVIFQCIARHDQFLGPIYATVFILLFLCAPRWGSVDKILSYLGRHSMNMWLIHAWFCYYLFHDELYSMKYPVLILVVLLLLSIILSNVVEFLCSTIVKFISSVTPYIRIKRQI